MNHRSKYWLTLLVALFVSVPVSVAQNGETVFDDDFEDNVVLGVRVVDLSLGSLQNTDGSLSRRTVGPSGGTVAIDDSGSPLDGLEIKVPEGATDETIEFSVDYAAVNSQQGLPTGTAIRSLAIRIAARGSDDWNKFAMFDKAIRVTLPYDNSTSDVVDFYSQNGDRSLEPTGHLSKDPAAGKITFWTRTFANTADDVDVFSARPVARRAKGQSALFTFYVAVGLAQQLWADWTNNGATINTGFTAAANGWFIPNYGSYYIQSRGGNCFGMVGFAKYYFRKMYATNLYSNYRDPQPTSTWLDDDVAIELASRVHNGMANIWNQFVTGELNEQMASSSAVARSWVGAMYVTGVPALIGIYQNVNGQLTGGHAILTYRANIDSSGNITFYIYDPNHPNKDDRRIVYTNGIGFAQPYLSGTTAGNSAFNYNTFYHVGYNVGLSDAVLDQLKNSADAGFTNDSVFPTVTVTSIVDPDTNEDVLARTGVTDEGQDKYLTNGTKVRIRGTVLGGLAQTAGSVVNNLNVLSPSGVLTTAIDNQAGGGSGEFDITVPLLFGENMVVLLASATNSFSHWAGFALLIIDSQASRSDMKITLTWNRNNSDIDLYVMEPDGPAGEIGDTVCWSDRRSSTGPNPFLDFDNTSGFGPENYIGTAGQVTLYTNGNAAASLYGTYKVRVNYYADHDSDSSRDQQIGWTLFWRYLAFCPEPCDDPESVGFWVSGSTGGLLTSAAPNSNCANISTGSGAGWSPFVMIPYDEPDPDDYQVADPPDVMLP